MKSRLLLATTLTLLGALCTSATAQQVTTEMIGPLSGSLTIAIPVGPPQCPASGQQDTITFTGNVHVSATYDPTQNTVDYHINLLSVKGTGTLVAKYIGSGATELLDQGFPGSSINVPISFSANLFPTGPCRSGFPSAGALPIVVTVSFGTDFTLSTLSAVVGQT
jgi:hypothetical protein